MGRFRSALDALAQRGLFTMTPRAAGVDAIHFETQAEEDTLVATSRTEIEGVVGEIVAELIQRGDLPSTDAGGVIHDNWNRFRATSIPTPVVPENLDELVVSAEGDAITIDFETAAENESEADAPSTADPLEADSASEHEAGSETGTESDRFETRDFDGEQLRQAEQSERESRSSTSDLLESASGEQADDDGRTDAVANAEAGAETEETESGTSETTEQSQNEQTQTEESEHPWPPALFQSDTADIDELRAKLGIATSKELSKAEGKKANSVVQPQGESSSGAQPHDAESPTPSSASEAQQFDLEDGSCDVAAPVADATGLTDLDVEGLFTEPSERQVESLDQVIEEDRDPDEVMKLVEQVLGIAPGIRVTSNRESSHDREDNLDGERVRERDLGHDQEDVESKTLAKEDSGQPGDLLASEPRSEGAESGVASTDGTDRVDTTLPLDIPVSKVPPAEQVAPFSNAKPEQKRLFPDNAPGDLGAAATSGEDTVGIREVATVTTDVGTDATRPFPISAGKPGDTDTRKAAYDPVLPTWANIGVSTSSDRTDPMRSQAGRAENSDTVSTQVISPSGSQLSATSSSSSSLAASAAAAGGVVGAAAASIQPRNESGKGASAQKTSETSVMDPKVMDPKVMDPKVRKADAVAKSRKPTDTQPIQVRYQPTGFEVSLAEKLLQSDFGVQVQQLSQQVFEQLPKGGSHVVLFTGLEPLPQQAKVVAGLGMLVCAQQTRPTLLVDGASDTREISRGMERTGSGLMDALSQQTPWEQSTHATSCEMLRFLPYGHKTLMPDVTDGLVPRMPQIVAQWKKQFGLILIDGGMVTSPTVKVLASSAAATFLCVRLGTTQREELLAATEYLVRIGADVKGCITAG